jgi:hypothetical protein
MQWALHMRQLEQWYGLATTLMSKLKKQELSELI